MTAISRVVQVSLLLILCGSLCKIGRAQVHVWEGRMAIPVYSEGAPDPNPPFEQFGGPINYPYTLRANLTNEKVEQQLRAIYLENEYLKCTVLPDLGGHLYTCIDKLSGQSMFYANPDIKKARISYRGAWSAFGDEFNFPVSHNWVSLSPVNFAFATHKDGSGSVTVSNVDRVYGMEWTVEMVLEPGSTVLRENVTLANPSDVRHRFYYWNNAGIQVWEDSKICYPTKFTAAHGFADVDTWPVNASGIDLSVLKNQQDGNVSRFVHESREPFIGVWHPHTNTGTVHFAEYDELPGKKFWSWGDDAPGREWRKILSDNDSAYVEVQAGPFRNQETFGFMAPHTSMHFSEFWIPVRGLGGVARANLSGAVNLQRESGRVIVSVNVNKDTKDAHLHLAQGSNLVWEERADLKPEKTWTKAVPAAHGEAYRIEITDAAGNLLIAQTEDEYDTTPANEVRTGKMPPVTFPEKEKRSADDWLWVAGKDEEFGQVLTALETYREGLQKYPKSLSLLKANGRLLAAMDRYEEAIPALEAARYADTTDPETAYYLAVAYEAKGEERRAQTMFENATRLTGLQAAAYLHLGELAARRHVLNAAISYLLRAQALSERDERIAEELTAVQMSVHPGMKLDVVLSSFPTSPVLMELAGKPDEHHLAADSFRVLRVASEFMKLGMYERALTVLSRTYPNVPPIEAEPGTVAPQANPVVLYYRAYCEKRLGRNPDKTLRAAEAATTRYIFPRGMYDHAVLSDAVAADGSDANAQWLLGQEEFSRGITDSAMEHWSRAVAINPSIPAAYSSRGKTELLVRKDAAAALSEFEQGRKHDPLNPDSYVGSDQALSILGKSPSSIAAALQSFPDQKSMTQPMAFELAMTDAEAGHFDQGTFIFQDRFFSSGEGDTDIRQVWVEFRLQKARRLAHLHQCSASLKELDDLGAPSPGLGFTQQILPAMTAGARVQFLTAEIQETCGKQREATRAYEDAAQHANADEVYWAGKAAAKLHRDSAATWKERYEAALVEAQRQHDTTADVSYWTYVCATLNRALGRSDAARTFSNEALLSADRQLAYHLVRLEKEEDANPTGQSTNSALLR